MSPQMNEELRTALERGQIKLVQALGITVEEETILAQQGFELMQAGKLFDAEKIFNGLIALNPVNSFYFAALGNIKKAMELPEEAEALLEKAVATNPNDLVALFSLADLHLRQKQKAKALPRLLQILYIDEKKASDQGREANTIVQKYFSKDEVRAYVDKELAKVPKK